MTNLTTMGNSVEFGPRQLPSTCLESWVYSYATVKLHLFSYLTVPVT